MFLPEHVLSMYVYSIKRDCALLGREHASSHVQTKKAKIFRKCKCKSNSKYLLLSSSDEFSVATPDETTGKDTEFSLVGSFRNKYILHLNVLRLC